MKYYIVMTRVLGCDWKRLVIGDDEYETSDLAEAIGMKETIQDGITEAMVVSIDASMAILNDQTLVTKKYELVE